MPLRAVQHSLLEAPQDTARSSHLPIPAPFPDLLLSPSLQLHPGPWDCLLRKVLLRNLFQAPPPGSQPKPLVPRTHGTQVLPRIPSFSCGTLNAGKAQCGDCPCAGARVFVGARFRCVQSCWLSLCPLLARSVRPRAGALCSALGRG